jgi:hypothetical protein
MYIADFSIAVGLRVRLKLGLEYDCYSKHTQLRLKSTGQWHTASLARMVKS